MIENLFWVSVQSSLLIIFIILFRKVFKKSHKIFTYVMWLIVLIRLCIPIQIESRYGLINLNYNYGKENIIMMPEEDLGINNIINNTEVEIKPKPDINNDSIIHQSPTENHIENITQNEALKDDTNKSDTHISDNDLLISKKIWDVESIITLIWIVGMLIVTGFILSQIIIMRNKVRFAVREKDNIWITDGINSAFVAGVFRPRIYLPTDINNNQKAYILLHEKMHIRHKDYLIRNLIMIVNIVYWWNPLIWYATHLMKQDMEMFCDESVIKQLEKKGQKEYLNTLLSSAGQNSGIIPVMTFGESNVERRISHMINVKKTRPYIVIVLVLFAGICLGVFISKKNVDSKRDEAVSDSGIEGSVDEPTQEQVEDSSKPISKYDMSVVNKVTYEQNRTGKWDLYGYIFENKSFVSGIIPGEDVRTTFVVLNKYGCGTFENIAQMAKESRYKSRFDDTEQIVEHIKHDYKLQDGIYIAERTQDTIKLSDSIIEICNGDTSYGGWSYKNTVEYNYYIENDNINIFNNTENDKINIVDDVTLQYRGTKYIHIDSSGKKAVKVRNGTGYELYDELIKKINYISETDNSFTGYKNIGVSYVFGYPEGYVKGGFHLIDLDNDGIEELLLGKNETGAWKGVFYDIYTIKDDKLVQVVSGGERDTYRLCKENIIWNEGTGGASNGHDAYYTYSDGKLNLIECVLMDGSYGGTRDPYDGLDNDFFLCGEEFDARKGVPITREESVQIKNKYKKIEFEFISFSTTYYK